MLLLAEQCRCEMPVENNDVDLIAPVAKAMRNL
jgi:hypothetical protein